MSEETESKAAMSSSSNTVNEFFFELLTRELNAKGENKAAAGLSDILKLRVDKEDQSKDGTSIELTLSQKLTQYSLRQNATSAEIVSWYLDFLSTHGDDSMPKEEALALAETTANLPDDAVLESADYEEAAGRCFFRVRWSHRVDDLPVEGDFIEVLINGAARRVFSLTRMWRSPDLSGAPKER